MTKIEALKELLKENFNELKDNTYINVLSIEFKGDEFIVLDKDKNVIFKDLLKNYDLDYDSQKRFILNVADSVTSFVEVLEDLDRDYFEDLINVDNDYYFNVIGSGDIYKTDTYISVNLENLYENCKKDCIEYCKEYYKGIIENCKDYEDIEDCEDFEKIYYDYCSVYISNIIDFYIEDIKNNFEDKGVRVVLYSDRYGYDIGFYVSAEINEDETYVSFIEDLEDIEKVEELKDLISYDTITLYYSSIEDEKEADKAVEFIKELVA